MIAYLTVSTFKGVVYDASHYQGHIRVKGQSEDIHLDHLLTKDQVKRLNKQCKESDDPYRYKLGDKCSRFFDEETLIAAAIEYAKANKIDVLYRGAHYVADPMLMIHGPEPLMTEANKIVAEAEANDWWEGDEDKMTAISKRWKALVAEVGTT
jgi:hypothetical protein